MERNELEVRLYGERVGVLRQSADNRLTFQYDASYGATDDAPPLSTCMPLRVRAYEPKVAEAWFEGLLPEGRRREHLARIVAAAGADTWSLLYAVGGECAGAVQIVAPEHTDAPGLFRLSDESLANLLKAPVEPLGTVGRAARISLAGAQEKLALHRNDDGSWSVPTGGHPSTHILKPETPSFPGLVENEHWCMEVARRAGLPAANTSVETIRDMQVLVVERYDRTRSTGGAIRRLHQEDMAQAFATTRKYQSEGGPSTYDLFRIEGLERNALFEHLMFSWLVGNCDAHAKNYSIVEPGTPNARLAPMYDVLSTECYEGLDRLLATKIGRIDALNAVSREAVEAMGRRVGFRAGEAAKRLQGLAERCRTAIEACEEEGLAHGPVNVASLLARMDRACEWSQSPHP